MSKRDQIEVDACPNDGSECDERSICGTTIYCKIDPTCEAFDAAPIMCPEGYQLGGECDNSDPERPCIEFPGVCGRISYCNPDPISECLALPACEDGAFEVESCKLNDVDCTEVTVCNQTISCAPLSACLALPSCQEDEDAYETKEACNSETESCRQEYTCGSTIWCGGQNECLAPNCGDQAQAPGCEDPDRCYEVFGCGESAICER